MKLGVLLAVAWMSLPLPAAATSSERFAIIIGNNIGAADEPALRYAETDALRVYDVLRELGGYEPTNMALLRGADAETVRSSLIAWNDRIRERSSAPNTEVVLFVYYSGHADPGRQRTAKNARPCASRDWRVLVVARFGERNGGCGSRRSR
jgi:hypothetical protein